MFQTLGKVQKIAAWILVAVILVALLVFAWRWLAPALVGLGLGLLARRKPSTETKEVEQVIADVKAKQEEQKKEEADLAARAESLEERVKKRRAREKKTVSPGGTLVIILVVLVALSGAAPVARADAEDDLDEALAIIKEYQRIVTEKNELIDRLTEELRTLSLDFQELASGKAESEGQLDEALAIIGDYKSQLAKKDALLQEAIAGLEKARAALAERDGILAAKDALIEHQKTEIARLRAPKWSPSVGGYYSPDDGFEYDFGIGRSSPAYWWRTSVAPESERVGLTFGINF